MTIEQDNPLIREFVLAGHFDLEKIKTLLAEQPDLLDTPFLWNGTDSETALQAAGHVGNRAIAEYLLGQGAKLEIGVAAMLGLRTDVDAFLAQDASLANAVVVHNFRVLYHAALSGDVELVEILIKHGCNTDFNQALHAAVSKGNLPMAQWLLTHGVTDPNTPNYQGKSPLTQAIERDLPELTALLRAHGGVESAPQAK